jgi:ABC-2 type transport system ATP-binding protein
MSALSVKKLEKTYASGTQALKGIDLEIPQGSFFGLLGPNGAGKSTLIHCIMGLAVPTGGKAEVFGHDIVTDYRAARASVGLAPQDVNLDWFLTVEGTLDYHGGYYGMPKKERMERIDECYPAV